MKKPAKRKKDKMPVEEIVELSDYEQAFVDAYRGCASDAMRAAGHTTESTLRSAAWRMFHRPHVRKAIEERGKRDRRCRPDLGAIMDRQELEAFWSGIVEDPFVSLAEKKWASENLAKAKGLFIERRVIEGGDKPLQIGVSKTDVDTRIAAILGREFE